MRTPLIVALVASLVGCSSQPPQQEATISCAGIYPFGCSTPVRQPTEPVSVKAYPADNEHRPVVAEKVDKPPSKHRRHAVRLAGKSEKAARALASAEPRGDSRIPLPPRPPKAQPEPAVADAAPASGNGAGQEATVGVANPVTVQAQIEAATVMAERVTMASASAAADAKASSRERSGRSGGARGTETIASAATNDMDFLVAVVMARPGVKSLSELTGKTIAIDDRYAKSSGSVRSAIVAAGAPEVQLNEGQTTAINRLVSGEVSAAVLALVSADAAEGFPEIAGYKIFHVPLSPRSLKARQ